MDDFDFLNQPSQAPSTSTVEITNVPEDDLFGNENTTVIQSDNNFSDSWITDNTVNDTTSLQTSSFNNETIINQSTENAFDSYPPTENVFNSYPATENAFDSYPATENAFDSYPATESQQVNKDELTGDMQHLPIEEGSSYDMFSPPIPTAVTPSANIFTTGISSEENLSALEAFNRRRQQEIAEKDAEENKKISALKQQAQQDIERWYNERKIRMSQNRQNIDQAENELRKKALETSNKLDCDWPKMIRFLEFSSGTQLSKGKRDLSRMKAAILNAKRDREKRQSVNSS